MVCQDLERTHDTATPHRLMESPTKPHAEWRAQLLRDSSKFTKVGGAVETSRIATCNRFMGVLARNGNTL